MSTGTGAPSDMGANGNGSDNSNAGAGDIDAKINKAIVNHLSRFEKKIASMFEGETFGKVLEAQLERIADAAVADAGTPTAPGKSVPNGGDETQRLTMKTLQTQVEQLQKALQTQQKAAQEADARAKDLRMRSEVERHLTAKLGANNPLVGTLMDSLYDVKKRFVEGPDGRLSVKFTDPVYGTDEFRPLEDGVSALFDGELKALVQQSKAPALPPNGFARAAFGQPMPHVPQVAQGQQNQRANPLLMEVAQSIAGERPEAAQILATDAIRLGSNGTRK